MIEDLFGLLSAVIIIIAVMALAYLFTRHVVGRFGQSGLIAGTYGAKPRKKRISVLEQVAIGKDQRLLLVKMDEEIYFLAVTPTGANLLKEVPPEQVQRWNTEDSELLSDMPSDFQTSLKKVIDNMKNKGGKE